MSSHRLNLGLRFVLELCMLAALGAFGYGIDHDVLRWVAMLGLPLLAAALWGVFAVPDDPSRSGKTVVETRGWVRLLLELSLFGLGVAALFLIGARGLGVAFGVAVALHYAASGDRIRWLLER